MHFLNEGLHKYEKTKVWLYVSGPLNVVHHGVSLEVQL